MVRTTRASRSGMPADVVDDLLALEVVEQPVDREVAAARVLLGRAEDVVPADQQVAALGLGAVAAAFLFLHLARVGAERGRLDDLRSEEDVREAEAAPDDAAVLEEAPDVVGRRAGDDVEVLGLAAEQQVADAAADQVGGVIVAAQALDDFGGVGIYRVRFYLHSRLGVPHQRREITAYRRFDARRATVDGGQRRVRILEDGRLAAVSAGLARRRRGVVARPCGRSGARTPIAGTISARRAVAAGSRRARPRSWAPAVARSGRASARPRASARSRGRRGGAPAAGAGGGRGLAGGRRCRRTIPRRGCRGRRGAGWCGQRLDRGRGAVAQPAGPPAPPPDRVRTAFPRTLVQANHATPTTATPPIRAITFAKALDRGSGTSVCVSGS